jgi:AcrR family transcriptional regulator
MTNSPTKGLGPGRPKDEGLAARRREEILRNAIRHFAASGYADADLDAIAADVGCAKGTLYRYFQSKEDLFHHAVDFVMQGLLEAISATDSEDAIEQLEHGIRSHLAYFDEHPDYVELLMLERAEFRDRKKPTYFEHREASSERWKKRFEELMRAGKFRRMHVQRVLDVIGSLLYGTIFTNHFAGRRQTLEQQAAGVLAILFHGLLTPEESARRQSQQGT